MAENAFFHHVGTLNAILLIGCRFFGIKINTTLMVECAGIVRASRNAGTARDAGFVINNNDTVFKFNAGAGWAYVYTLGIFAMHACMRKVCTPRCADFFAPLTDIKRYPRNSWALVVERVW